MGKRQGAGQDPSINLVKFVACFMVIMLHVSSINIYNMSFSGWDTSIWLVSFLRVCVPLFFMISGSLLLMHDESPWKFLRKRYIRIIPPLIFWSAVYVIYRSIYGMDYGNPFIYILAKPADGILWYLYALIGLYAVMPFFRKIYAHSSVSEKAFLICIWFLSTSISSINECFSASIDVSIYRLDSIGGFIGLFFLGAVSRNFFSMLSKKSIIACLLIYIATGVAIAELVDWASTARGSLADVFYWYLSPLVIIGSVFLFTALHNIGQHIKSKSNMQLLSILSDCALGIYCIHIIIRDELYRIGMTGANAPYFANIVVTSISVFALSFLAIYLLRKIKPLRRVL